MGYDPNTMGALNSMPVAGQGMRVFGLLPDSPGMQFGGLGQSMIPGLFRQKHKRPGLLGQLFRDVRPNTPAITGEIHGGGAFDPEAMLGGIKPLDTPHVAGVTGGDGHGIDH